MRKAKTVFGSAPEGKTFQSIALHLPQGWKVYPNLPLSQLVRVGKHEISESEWELYLKTSVDFTLVEGPQIGNGLAAPKVMKHRPPGDRRPKDNE